MFVIRLWNFEANLFVGQVDKFNVGEHFFDLQLLRIVSVQTHESHEILKRVTKVFELLIDGLLTHKPVLVRPSNYSRSKLQTRVGENHVYSMRSKARQDGSLSADVDSEQRINLPVH